MGTMVYGFSRTAGERDVAHFYEQARAMVSFLRDLLRFRLRGTLEPLETDRDPLLAYTRTLGGQRLLVLANMGETPLRDFSVSVDGFEPGDEVWYAGELTRPGTNSEFHLVDERIVGRKPSSLSFAEAAALPLTTITAYESLFHRLRIDRDAGTNYMKETSALVTIRSSGKVGIGSTATDPSEQLEVAGKVKATGDSAGFCIGADCITGWSAAGGSVWTESGGDISRVDGKVGIGAA